MDKLLDRLTNRIADRFVEKMNRKIFEVASVNIKPGDVLVLKSKSFLSAYATEHILESLKEIFPRQRIVVLEDGLEFAVVSGIMLPEHRLHWPNRSDSATGCPFCGVSAEDIANFNEASPEPPSA